MSETVAGVAESLKGHRVFLEQIRRNEQLDGGGRFRARQPVRQRWFYD